MKVFTLRNKFVLLFIVFAVIPCLLVGAFSYRTTYNALWENTNHSTMLLAAQLNKTMDTLFFDAERFIEIGKSEYINDYILHEGDQYASAKGILSQFMIYRRNFPYSDAITNIYVIGTNGKGISERYGVFDAPESQKLLDFSRYFFDTANSRITIGNIEGKGEKTYIYIGKALSRPALREPIGSVVIEIESDLINDFCSGMDIAKSGYFFVADENGDVLFAPDKVLSPPSQRLSGMSRGSFTHSGEAGESFYVVDTNERTGWKIVGTAPIADLMSEATEIGNTTIFIILLIVVFAAGMYLVFTGNIIRPLRRLKATMQIASLGDMSVRFEGKTKDEIADLGNSFNKMIEQIDALGQQNLKKQTSLQKAEMNLLQAQINPHFLYNTLDTIIWLAKTHKTQQVTDMVEALSTFFRITLSKGRERISVEQEVEMVKNYLIIQQIRYYDVMKYSIEVEECMLKYPILKLTLQPLVENALYHGIKNKRGGGTIWIKGFDKGQYLLFTIEDDGAGICHERMEVLMGELMFSGANMEFSDRQGFGIKNVNSRIKLFYGKQSGLRICNREGGGTVVEAKICKEGMDV